MNGTKGGIGPRIFQIHRWLLEAEVEARTESGM
jgi:hypothetical protein